MIIVNDRTPVCGHDPEQITEQLQTLVSQLRAECILLDFQRPNEPETAAITRAILHGLPCPVGVAEGYAGELDCPVLLPPPPPDRPLKDYLQPWKHREIWLEAALSALTITVTEAGSRYEASSSLEAAEPCFAEDDLLCHYHIAVSDTQARFDLYRTASDLTALLQASEELGITRAVGLYQELGNFTPFP